MGIYKLTDPRVFVRSLKFPNTIEYISENKVATMKACHIKNIKIKLWKLHIGTCITEIIFLSTQIKYIPLILHK